MVQKKRIAAKSKSKPAPKPAKSKAIKPPKVTLNSIQLTLNKVVDKLGHHDTLFEKIDQRFDGIDQKLTTLHETVQKQGVIQEKMQGDIKLLAEGFESLDKKIDGVEERLNTKIDESVIDLKAAISVLSTKYGHEAPFPSERENAV